MKTFLLSSFLKGSFFLLLLFSGCFFLVHFFKLAKRGYEADKQKPPEPTPKKEKEPEPKKSPEPVYYIVEKKKKRPKTNYSEPKEFRFK